MRTHTEGTGGEHTALLLRGLCTLLVQDIQQHAVLSLARHDHHIVEVLGSGTDQ